VREITWLNDKTEKKIYIRSYISQDWKLLSYQIINLQVNWEIKSILWCVVDYFSDLWRWVTKKSLSGNNQSPRLLYRTTVTIKWQKRTISSLLIFFFFNFTITTYYFFSSPNGPNIDKKKCLRFYKSHNYYDVR